MYNLLSFFQIAKKIQFKGLFVNFDVLSSFNMLNNKYRGKILIYGVKYSTNRLVFIIYHVFWG